MKTIFGSYMDAVTKCCGRAIGRLAEINYYSARAYYKYRLYRSSRKYSRSPLLVYQMGKVGSKTVEMSLRALELDMPIYHPHFLTKARIAETEAKRKTFFRTQRYSYLKRPWLYQFLRKQIQSGLKDKKWKIVTLTREPIARNISTFFENLEVKVLDLPDQYEIRSHYYDIDPTIVTLDNLQQLTDLFFDRLHHDSPLDFFDRELKRVFGIDVFASEFPKSKGYKIYQEKHADVLLMRLENLNECARDAFKDFLGIEGFTLININIGRAKDYAPIYQSFVDSIALPDTYINKMYRSKYMQHFYNEEEIDRFEAKWRSSGI